MATRVTELSNSITEKMDEEEPKGMVRLLRQCDAQLFAGFESYEAVTDVSVLDKICNISSRMACLLQENKAKGTRNVIVFSGCGTSGRMGWLAALRFNRLVEHLGGDPCFTYLISGGDESLVISNELPEDDPLQGAKDLEVATKQASTVLFVGITCGLSAPYVAGQVHYAMSQPNFITVLMGFNLVELSRDDKLLKWDKTCKQVFCELDEMSTKNPDRAFVLNPVVGPEAVTGSSRMKGGSMTKILLDTVSLLGISQGYGLPLDVVLGCARNDGRTVLSDGRRSQLSSEDTTSVTVHSSSVGLECGVGSGTQDSEDFHPSGVSGGVNVVDVLRILLMYQNVMFRVYSGPLCEDIAGLVSLAREALCSPEGHLYIVGSEVFGLVGIIDVSEMVDTYGAELSEVKAFVRRGWAVCKATSGDLTGRGPLFHISVEDFSEEVMPGLACTDTVLVIQDTVEPFDREFVNRVLSSPAQCALVEICSVEQKPSEVDDRWKMVVQMDLPYHSTVGNVSLFADFAVKLVLNIITTCANVLKGRVYGNTMINLTLANSKLFQRAVGIVQKITDTKKCFAEECLKLSIIRSEVYDKKSFSLEELIQKATNTKLVIPMAILLALQGKEFQEEDFTWQDSLSSGNPLAREAFDNVTDKIKQVVEGQKVTVKSLMRKT